MKIQRLWNCWKKNTHQCPSAEKWYRAQKIQQEGLLVLPHQFCYQDTVRESIKLDGKNILPKNIDSACFQKQAHKTFNFYHVNSKKTIIIFETKKSSTISNLYIIYTFRLELRYINILILKKRPNFKYSLITYVSKMSSLFM